MQREIDLAIAALQTAIELNFEYRELAKTDGDFDQIRASAAFQVLTSA